MWRKWGSKKLKSCQKSQIVRAERKAGLCIHVLLSIPKRECQFSPRKYLGDVSWVVSLLISPCLCLCVTVFPFTQSRHAVAGHGAWVHVMGSCCQLCFFLLCTADWSWRLHSQPRPVSWVCHGIVSSFLLLLQAAEEQGMEALSSGLTGHVCTASSLPDHVDNWRATSGPERKREPQADTYASLNLHLVPEPSFAYWNFTTSPCRLTQASKSQWCLSGRAIWQEGHANKLNKINCKHTP